MLVGKEGFYANDDAPKVRRSRPGELCRQVCHMRAKFVAPEMAELRSGAATAHRLLDGPRLVLTVMKTVTKFRLPDDGETE